MSGIHTPFGQCRNIFLIIECHNSFIGIDTAAGSSRSTFPLIRLFRHGRWCIIRDRWTEWFRGLYRIDFDGNNLVFLTS